MIHVVGNCVESRYVSLDCLCVLGRNRIVVR